MRRWRPTRGIEEGTVSVRCRERDRGAVRETDRSRAGVSVCLQTQAAGAARCGDAHSCGSPRDSYSREQEDREISQLSGTQEKPYLYRRRVIPKEGRDSYPKYQVRLWKRCKVIAGEDEGRREKGRNKLFKVHKSA